MVGRRHVSLRPAPPPILPQAVVENARPFNLTTTELVENKRRRIGVSVACDNCRKKKIRCDGQRPKCSACEGKTEPCQYRDDSPVTKESSRILLEVIKTLSNLPDEEAIRTLQVLRDENDAKNILSILRGDPSALHRPSDLSTAVVIMDNTLQSLELGAQYPTAYPKLPGITTDSLKAKRYHELIVPTEQPTVPALRLTLSEPDSDSTRESSNSEPPPFGEVNGAEQVPWICDPQLAHLKIDNWTKVSISNDTAARAISLYLETDHPLLGHFDPGLFISDLVAPREVYCSPLLVNALLFWATQMYTAFDPTVKNLPLQFCSEAESIWTAQRDSPDADTITNLAAVQFLCMGYLGQGRDHSVLRYLAEVCEMGIRMGFYGVDDDRAQKRMEKLSEDAARAQLYAAWGSFSWLTQFAMFYHQPGLQCPQSPPRLPIPYDAGTSDVTGSTYAIPTSPLPSYMGGLFPYLCRFWQIVHEVALVYYTEGHAIDDHFTALRFAEFKYRELLAWSSGLPSHLSRNGEIQHYVQILHIWLHAAILDIFRPHVNVPAHLKRRLSTFSSSISMPDIIVHASVSQLKRLIIDYRLHYSSSGYTLLWHTALIYVANAVMQESHHGSTNGNGEGRLFFLLVCVYGYERLRRSWRVAEAITAGILSMVMRQGDMSSHKARDVLNDLQQRSPVAILPGKIRASFMVDLDLAMSNPEAATVEELAGSFEDNALIGEYTNFFGEQPSVNN